MRGGCFASPYRHRSGECHTNAVYHEHNTMTRATDSRTILSAIRKGIIQPPTLKRGETIQERISGYSTGNLKSVAGRIRAAEKRGESGLPWGAGRGHVARTARGTRRVAEHKQYRVIRSDKRTFLFNEVEEHVERHSAHMAAARGLPPTEYVRFVIEGEVYCAPGSNVRKYLRKDQEEPEEDEEPGEVDTYPIRIGGAIDRASLLLKLGEYKRDGSDFDVVGFAKWLKPLEKCNWDEITYVAYGPGLGTKQGRP